MAFLELRDVSKSFSVKGGKQDFIALDRISMIVERREFVALIGHSGCGKSTLLNLIAGLLLPTAGKIACEDKPVLGPGPDRAMVFQSHALLPWMTCVENVELGVRQAQRSLAEQGEDASRAGQLEPGDMAQPGKSSAWGPRGSVVGLTGAARAPTIAGWQP